MRKMRKLLAVTLVAAMVLGVFSVGFAASSVKNTAFTDVAADHEAVGQFGLLNALGIFKGYGDGTVGPNDTLTREQFATVVVRMLDRTKTADAVANFPTNFSDDDAISSWARGSVVVASNMGIITGYPDGSFKPQGNVTFAEAYAMLARALKLDAAAVGSWPTNYIMLANEIGLDAGVDTLANMPITRSEMAIMTVNAMKDDHTWNKTTEVLVPASTTSLLAGRTVTGYTADFATAGLTFADNVTITGAKSVSELAGFGGWYVLNADGKVVFVAAESYGKAVANSITATGVDATLGSYFTLSDGSKVFWNSGTPQTGTINGVGANASNLVVGDKVNFTFNTAGTMVSFTAERVNLTNGVVTTAGTATGTTPVIATFAIGADVFDITETTKITVNGEAATYAALTANVIIDELVVDSTVAATNGDTALSIKATKKTYTGQFKSTYQLTTSAGTVSYLDFTQDGGTTLNTFVDGINAGPGLTGNNYYTVYFNASNEVRLVTGAIASEQLARLDSFNATTGKLFTNKDGVVKEYTQEAGYAGTALASGQIGFYLDIVVEPDGTYSDIKPATNKWVNTYVAGTGGNIVTVFSIDSATGVVIFKVETRDAADVVTGTAYHALGSTAFVTFDASGAAGSLSAGDKVNVFDRAGVAGGQIVVKK